MYIQRQSAISKQQVGKQRPVIVPSSLGSGEVAKTSLGILGILLAVAPIVLITYTAWKVRKL